MNNKIIKSKKVEQLANCFNIPKDCKIIGISKGNLEVERPDKLRVFLNTNDDQFINNIRLTANDKRLVILAVGLYRGMQIANNYQETYSEKSNVDFMAFFKALASKMPKQKQFKIFTVEATNDIN